jgi:hypothetical protein
MKFLKIMLSEGMKWDEVENNQVVRQLGLCNRCSCYASQNHCIDSQLQIFLQVAK